jgi:hypothetical protein
MLGSAMWRHSNAVRPDGTSGVAGLVISWY